MSNENDWYDEVSDGLKRAVPPEMIVHSKLSEWQAQHQLSTNGLFSSIYHYPTNDPYLGGVISDFYMDFDNEENPEKAKKEVVAVIKKLREYDISQDVINICFSGKKGFSLTIDYKIFNLEASADLPLILKSIVQELADKLNLTTVDMVIYQRRQLWRRPNSIHQTTGLYKIPIPAEDLEKLTIKDIKEIAKLPQAQIINSEAKLVPKAGKLFLEHKAKVENWYNERKKTFEKNELTTFVDDPPCVKRLLETGAIKGERNNSTFNVAIYYASKELCYDDILKICITFNAKCDDPLTEREIATIVKSSMKGVEEKKYSVGCKTELLSIRCDKPNCPFFHKEETKENKCSCGGDLPDKVFEQVENQQFLVYNKETGEITRQKTVDRTKPIAQLLWKTPASA
jgi:hypothetical protein